MLLDRNYASSYIYLIGRLFYLEQTAEEAKVQNAQRIVLIPVCLVVVRDILFKLNMNEGRI